MAEALGWTSLAFTDPTGASVLVVDDEPGIRTALRKVLERFGYTVFTAESAEEADQLMTGQRFDVLLLDIGLHGMSGFEFLNWALGKDPELAVIMLTGLDNPEVALECLRAGARTYLGKPFDSDFMELALRDAVALSRLLKERNELAGGGNRE